MKALPRLAVVVVLCGVTSCSPGAPPPPAAEAADAGRGADLTWVSGTGTDSKTGGCLPDQSNPEAPAGHVDNGTPLDYAGVPPVSGIHWRMWPDIEKVLYVAVERPGTAELVHSQEHGWTFVWYDESIAVDEQAMADLARLAADIEPLSKTSVVPWTRDDGEAFPSGTHVALTHWTATGTKDGTEWRQFCDVADRSAVTAFTERHPYTDGHEPAGP